MSIFNKTFNDIINESIIDIPRNSLDPTVFQFNDNIPPIMHPIIKMQIMNDIEKFRDIVPVTIYFVVGSILTKKYTPRSDIDVNVQIDSKDDTITEEIFDLIKNINGYLAAGTTHPINYYVIKDDYNFNNTDAAYDVKNEVWIKEPENDDVNVQKYMNKFQTTVNGIDFNAAELRRTIIDYEELKKMDTDQIANLQGKVELKLKEIEDTVESLVRQYKNIKSIRKQSFEKDMSPTEIRKYGKKNKLPENIIYKLLERYYYFEFMKELKRVLEDDKITDKEISDIKRAGREFWK